MPRGDRQAPAGDRAAPDGSDFVKREVPECLQHAGVLHPEIYRDREQTADGRGAEPR